MTIIFLLLAAFFFLIGALAPLFHFSYGDINVHFWGLFFFVLSFLAPHFGTIRSAFRDR
jgi:hypothetical protein